MCVWVVVKNCRQTRLSASSQSIEEEGADDLSDLLRCLLVDAEVVELREYMRLRPWEDGRQSLQRRKDNESYPVT